MSRTWSDQQAAIFNWFASGAGNLVVRARAGTGKTTTIIEAITHAPEQRILLAAFNKKIAVELGERLTNPNAEAQTLHQVGFAAVRRYWAGVRVASGRDEREADLAYRSITDRAPNQVPDSVVRLIGKLHSKAREMAPFASKPGDLIDLAYAFDILPDEYAVADGFDLAWIETCALRAMVLAAEKKPTTGIDFSDMLYLPVRNGWLRPIYDLVVIDEAQDMNACQIILARGVCAGRIAVVGDDRQGIYGFRGADSKSIDRLKTELNAIELGLTVTYRCGKAIVDLAAKIVPDFSAAPSAPAGKVEEMAFDKAMEMAAPGDFVLSRKNAPLVGCALRILRSGRRAKIEGRDIGAGLKSLIRQLARGAASSSMPRFLEKLKIWEAKEVKRAEAAGQDAKIETIRDRAETLRSLADGLSGVRELEARIDDLFADDPNRAYIICSSVHRSKGLEADRVFVLADTLHPNLPPKVATPDRLREEQNIEYVAITRAKSHLIWVAGVA